MNLIEVQRETLYQLLVRYPNGLTEEGWDIELLSKNRSLPFCYVKENLHLPWNWESLIDDNCEDMSYQDLMDHKSYWIDIKGIWMTLFWSQHLCDELINFYFANKNLSEEEIYEAWANISFNCTREMIFKYWDDLDWPIILQGSDQIDLGFIEEYHHFFHVEYPQKYNEHFMISLSYNNNIKISMEMIDLYQDEIDWEVFSENGRLSCQIIDNYYHRLDYLGNDSIWYTISTRVSWLYDESSEIDGSMYCTPECLDFIDRYNEHLYWDDFSKAIFLYPEIIERFKNKIKWSTFGEYHRWALSQLKQYSNRIGETRFVSLAIKKCLDELDPNILSIWSLSSLQWDIISNDPKITPEILERYSDKLDYDLLSSNSSVPYDFIFSHPEKSWNHRELSKRTYLPSMKGRRVKSARKE